MACRLKRSWCGWSLRTGTRLIGSIDMLVNLGVGVVRFIRAVSSHHGSSYDVTIVIVTSAFVLVVFSVLLVYAAQHRRRQLVLPWLIVQFIERCFLAVFIAVGLVRNKLGILPVILILVAIAFAFYLWWVVCSFYFQLQIDETHELRHSESFSQQASSGRDDALAETV